ncbi:hypothetical protein PAPYR_6580 [Paratrimastix pyriformis]|uniref:Uncharacterized protein n=1 Tax=Paratrimastix pyriformis TaxID=342808 RepID=A0ABQ8UF90_9EUKA|nr:hypothetical protein PAPYR_6580 [Paratrimastix pyriformis]
MGGGYHVQQAASSGTVVKRTANGTINAAVINAAGGNLTAQTLRLSGLASGDVYSTNGAITVVANRDRTGFESFGNTPGYAFDASYHLAVESGTGWVAGKRFAWTPAVLNTDTTLGTPRISQLELRRTTISTVDTSPLHDRARSRQTTLTRLRSHANGTQLALAVYLSYRGITINTSIIARTSSGAQHKLQRTPTRVDACGGPIVVDILSPNTFTSAPEAAISIDNRATSIQFVGSLCFTSCPWVILQNATSVVASTYPIRPPSAPTREKLVLTMNDLSDSMFSINGGMQDIPA